MKIALIGATGYVGAALLEEALNRGHQVTALVRHPEKLPQHANLSAQRADVHDVASLTEQLRGHDAVLSAFNPGWDQADIREQFIAGSQAIVAATKAAGIRRLLMVGGAGPATARHAGLPRRIQGRRRRRAPGPEPAARRAGTGVDLPLPRRPAATRPAHRPVPPRRR